MEDKTKIHDCIQLIRKLPINKMNDNIVALTNLIYEDDELLNEFLQKVDNRMEIEDSFIKCEHNRDGDSYRSPITNTYSPPLEEGRYPSKDLRALEEKMNKMFSIYTKAYYSSSALSSCYCWDLGNTIEEGFAVAILIKNKVDSQNNVDMGTWESNHVVNVTFTSEDGLVQCHYKLTSTIVLLMDFTHQLCGKGNMSGTVSRQASETHTAKTYLNEEFHITNIGKLVEQSENRMRDIIEEVYFKKSKEIVDTARYSAVTGKPNVEGANKLRDIINHR